MWINLRAKKLWSGVGFGDGFFEFGDVFLFAGSGWRFWPEGACRPYVANMWQWLPHRPAARRTNGAAGSRAAADLGLPAPWPAPWLRRESVKKPRDRDRPRLQSFQAWGKKGRAFCVQKKENSS